MQLRKKLKRFAALVLSATMMLTCMPMAAMAENVATPTDFTIVEVIPNESDADVLEKDNDEVTLPDTIPDDLTDEPDEIEQEELTEPELPVESEQAEPEDTTAPVESVVDEQAEEPVNPDTDDSATTESEVTEQESEVPVDERHPIQAAIEEHGHIYVPTVRKTNVYEDARLSKDSLVYTTTNDIFLVMATEYTRHDTVKIWFLDEESYVVSGYVSVNDLDASYLLDEDISQINFLPLGKGMTAIGLMGLFIVNGSHPAVEVEIVPDPIPEQPEPETTDPVEEPIPDDEQELQNPEQESTTDEQIVENIPEDSEETDDTEDPADGQTEPDYAAPGSYVSVTTDTRVFGEIDEYATEDYYSDYYLGNFVKKATVQVLSVDADVFGGVWYQVRFLYGDDFANGKMKWTDYSTCWVLATETDAATSDSCTVTDFAYTMEFFQMTKRMKARMATTPMDGFTLKNISGKVGGFYAWQQGLYGSSGKDSDYPQIAKSAAHGTIYATPHYLEGFTVFCLEHNLSGPGEGSGSSQSAKGPYVLVDMDTFVNNPDAGGVSGVRYKASTMHALGWVLRHTYPFMAVNRSDSNNETWSRVAGQFAMREVIKRLEGAQYVRSYWDMDNFYSFSGGAPAVYLTYARWLATNGIARASITGNITASNQSLSVSGSNYIGTVTLTTDADLIRIPKSVGTLTGNSGGSDSSYYYIKSGDTIKVTSSQSRFAVTMESISSSDEEASFLVGVPSVSIQKILVPTYGAPYAMKSASVTFELSLGEIVVTKKSTDGLLLQGTVFELLNSSGTVLATATTAANGKATFASLQPGTYTVREKTPSQGYKLAATSTQNISVVAGVTSTATFTNERISGRIRIVKTDSMTSKPLPGATFTVTRLSGPASDNATDIGKVVATITTNAQGIAETGLLPYGEYRIVETGVPEGYIDPGYSTTAWIK